MRTRGDHRVFTEPFSVAFYMGPEQRSDRFPVTEPEASFEAVLAQVLRDAEGGPVFVKEMAYQLGPLLELQVLQRLRSTFLIRDPAQALPSLARIWPDFTAEEAGYEAQHRAWSLLARAGEEPVVIDSDDLRRNPGSVVEAWCAAVGIPPRPDALTWEPGMPAEWARWADWFTSAAASRGFEPPAQEHSAEPPPPLTRRIEACRPLYEQLAAARLGA